MTHNDKKTVRRICGNLERKKAIYFFLLWRENRTFM